MLDFNDKEGDRVELGDLLPQKIPENQKVIYDRDRILIATILLCMLCYTRNQRPNILKVTAGYFVYVNNTTKYMIENLHCMSFLVIYKTV